MAHRIIAKTKARNRNSLNRHKDGREPVTNLRFRFRKTERGIELRTFVDCLPVVIARLSEGDLKIIAHRKVARIIDLGFESRSWCKRASGAIEFM